MKLEQGAWHVKLQLNTTGLTLNIPQAIRKGLRNILPVESVTLYDVGFSGLISTATVGDKVKNLKAAVDKTKKNCRKSGA
jgi:hypothetical protein